jgi:hypothetical protein
VRAPTAGGDTLLHAVQAFAVVRAAVADIGAYGAYGGVAVEAGHHDMRRRSAHFGACHHQAEVPGLGVLTALLKAVMHRLGDARLVAGNARLDAFIEAMGMVVAVAVVMVLGHAVSVGFAVRVPG